MKHKPEVLKLMKEVKAFFDRDHSEKLNDSDSASMGTVESLSDLSKLSKKHRNTGNKRIKVMPLDN